ncbi:hypothetical protein ATANTOWER_031724 [Ataeniobius toweri]|uniref:Uncharacterized protein n=1 Tax=Ataeniobius toweri TaxID=208326 RepID=A0ABU7CJ39_9TELE|nr:hypothetical protein [Ataeniobius toweri]
MTPLVNCFSKTPGSTAPTQPKAHRSRADRAACLSSQSPLTSHQLICSANQYLQISALQHNPSELEPKVTNEGPDSFGKPAILGKVLSRSDIFGLCLWLCVCLPFA